MVAEISVINTHNNEDYGSFGKLLAGDANPQSHGWFIGGVGQYWLYPAWLWVNGIQKNRPPWFSPSRASTFSPNGGNLLFWMSPELSPPLPLCLHPSWLLDSFMLMVALDSVGHVQTNISLSISNKPYAKIQMLLHCCTYPIVPK